MSTQNIQAGNAGKTVIITGANGNAGTAAVENSWMKVIS